MRYLILTSLAVAGWINEVTTKKAPSRTESMAGVELQDLEKPPASRIDPLVTSNFTSALSLQQKLYATFVSPNAWKDYLAASATPARQYHAIHVVFNAIFDTIITDDDYEKPHTDFFWATFYSAAINWAVSVVYLMYLRWNNIPHKVTNADFSTEFLEITSAIIAIGSLIQDPSESGSISLGNQRILVGLALGLACSQMITGIKGKAFFQETAHNMIEAFARPDESSEPVTYLERFYYGTLRLLHASHILTLAYSLSDAITVLFQANSYLNNSLNALICATPVTALYFIESRLVLYALYSKKLPSWALNIATLGRCLYALNNAFFAMNAVAFLITVDRLKIEGIDDSEELYTSFLQCLTIYVPSLLVALPVFFIASREYKENFYDQLNRCAQLSGFNEQESLVAIIDAESEGNQSSDRIVLSAINKPNKEELSFNMLDAFTGHLVMRNNRASFFDQKETQQCNFRNAVPVTQNS